MRGFNGIEIFLFLINIIIGTGIFLNTIPVFNLLLGESWVAYLLSGIAMGPIIYSTYNLSCIYPGYSMNSLLVSSFGRNGSFYTVIYALSKIATSAIGMIFMSNILARWTGLATYVIFLSILMILFLMLKINFNINKFFMFLIMFLKISIILCVIGYLIFIFFCNGVIYLEENPLQFDQGFSLMGYMSQSISITLFAFAGFESLFAVSNLLQNKKQGAIILGLSFVAALFFYIVYQYAFSKILLIKGYTYFHGTILDLFHEISPHLFFLKYIEFSILMTCFGVTYGILYANINNIHVVLSELKREQILLSRLIGFLFLFSYSIIGFINIFILQQFSIFATIILYGLFVIQFYKIRRFLMVFILGMLSLVLFIGMHIYNAYVFLGFWGYGLYSLVVSFVLYYLRED